jgi:hypothetical protein
MQEPNILLPAQVNGEYNGHATSLPTTGARPRLLSHTRQTPVLLENLLEAINRDVHGFREGRRTLHSFFLHNDIGTCLNPPLGLGILPSPNQLVLPTANTSV